MSPNTKLLLAAVAFGLGDFFLASLDKHSAPSAVSILLLIPQLAFVVVQVLVLARLYRQSL